MQKTGYKLLKRLRASKNLEPSLTRIYTNLRQLNTGNTISDHHLATFLSQSCTKSKLINMIEIIISI